MFRPASVLLLCSASLVLTACPSQPPATPPPTSAPSPVASAADAGVAEVADAAPSSEAGPSGVMVQPGGPDRTGCPCADADMCSPGQLCVCTDGLGTDGKPTPGNVPVKNGQPGIGRCQFVTRLDISVCILHNGL
ncbi:MAG TPA: hypothetical protein PKD61_24415, partial [Polyangiaceae bacterium]|nr:hypothetical protein [Polyangiaceae bacterium]